MHRATDCAAGLGAQPDKLRGVVVEMRGDVGAAEKWANADRFRDSRYLHTRVMSVENVPISKFQISYLHVEGRTDPDYG